MKNIFRLLTLSLFISLFASCEDEDKTVYDIGITPENTGSMVILDVTSPVLDFTNLEGSAFTAIIETPNNNVVQYDVSVQRTGANGDSEVAFVKSLTSFPSELSISAPEIVDALGITLADLEAGDLFTLYGRTTDDQGRVFTFNNVDSDLGSEAGQRQAFQFQTFIACPFVPADIEGTYTVVNHRFDAFFGPQGATRTVVAGPGPDQFTIVGGALPLDGADDLIITVDSVTDAASYGGPTDAVHFNTFGPATYASVTGTVFSCTGLIDITINSNGFIPNFLTLQRN